MDAKDAETEFRAFVAAAGRRLDALTPVEGTQLMLDFYRSVRVDEGLMEHEGDMLLFQWGPYDRRGAEGFTIDITRQLILAGGEDDDIWQLSLRFVFGPVLTLAPLRSGDRWCGSLDELDDFERFVNTHVTTRTLGTRTDGRVHLGYDCVG